MLYFQFNTDNVIALKKNRVGDIVPFRRRKIFTVL